MDEVQGNVTSVPFHLRLVLHNTMFFVFSLPNRRQLGGIEKAKGGVLMPRLGKKRQQEGDEVRKKRFKSAIHPHREFLWAEMYQKVVIFSLDLLLWA